MTAQLEPLTDVVFRRWRNAKGNGTDVLALFPTVPADERGRYCSSYAHVGQHGSADYLLCILATVPVDATDPDVQALKRELESIGYRLRVIKRAPPRGRSLNIWRGV